MKYCESCGAMLNDNAAFCPNCGAHCQNNNAAYQPQTFQQQPVQQPVQPAMNYTAVQAQTEQKKNNTLIVLLVLLVVLLIAVILVIVMVLGSRSRNNAYSVVTTEAVTAAETTTVPTTAATTAPVTEAQPVPTQPPAPTTMPVAQPTVPSHDNSYYADRYEAAVVSTNRSNLNIRSGPGENYKVIGSVPNTGEVYILEYTNYDWWYIYYNGVKGYVSTDYLLLVDND